MVTLKNFNGTHHNKLVNALIKKNMEVRYVWYPNHLQNPLKNIKNIKLPMH